MREAPSRILLEALWNVGAVVQAYDPGAMYEAESIYGKRDDFTLFGTRDSALAGADALVIFYRMATHFGHRILNC